MANEAAAHPFLLANPELSVLFADWIEHRNEKGKQPLTSVAKRRAIAKLERWGPKRSIAAIEYSLEHNWDGIFEPHEVLQPLPQSRYVPIAPIQALPPRETLPKAAWDAAAQRLGYRKPETPQ